MEWDIYSFEGMRSGLWRKIEKACTVTVAESKVAFRIDDYIIGISWHIMNVHSQVGL